MKTKIGIKLNFGDVIINHWAGPNNPNRKLIVVDIGKHINCLSPNSKLYLRTQLCNDRQTLITVIGNIFDKDKFDSLTHDYEISNALTTKWHNKNTAKV